MTAPRHFQGELRVGQWVKDGDFDAMITRFYVADPEKNYEFFHKLGRVARRILPIWSDKHIEVCVARDDQGRPLQDQFKTILNFNEAGCTVDLEFS